LSAWSDASTRWSIALNARYKTPISPGERLATRTLKSPPRVTLSAVRASSRIGRAIACASHHASGKATANDTPTSSTETIRC
jgi:hypothetical protein